MNRVNEESKKFDFTAMKLFLAVVAIIFSVIVPNARAVPDNLVLYQPSILDKIISDFKSQQTDSFSRPVEKKVGSHLEA